VNDLTEPLPETPEFFVNGELIRVSKIKFGQLPEALKIATALRPYFEAAAKDGGSASDVDMLGMLRDRGESVFALVTLTTGLSIAKVRDLDIDQAVLIAGKVLEVNLDFFIRQVIPSVVSLLSGLTSALSSLRPATPGATSENTP
jgi:hypothetical protein